MLALEAGDFPAVLGDRPSLLTRLSFDLFASKAANFVL
jgi:hypothetical protein